MQDPKMGMRRYNYQCSPGHEVLVGGKWALGDLLHTEVGYFSALTLFLDIFF